MSVAWERWQHAEGYKYSPLDGGEDNDRCHLRNKRSCWNTTMALAGSLVAVSLLVLGTNAAPQLFGSGYGADGGSQSSCDSVQSGYQCDTAISHYWGQYSPFFSVESDISPSVPPFCEITFAQILSRHGARDPTASKTAVYNATIQQIHAKVHSYSGDYAFLASYQYTLGADQLTVFGQQELINSGIKFYRRYEHLANHLTPFVRSSSEARVVESAQNWTQGFHSAKASDYFAIRPDSAYPYPILVISEDEGQNNTLNHDLCTSFEDGIYSSIGNNAQKIWANIFLPPIQARLNENLPGANLSQTQALYMMDLCPFNTVASPNGTISPFCDLFTEDEWHQYDYYETLGKYYGYSYGNPLGPTQGIGFAHELIARMTNSPVVVADSINSTLDTNPTTFPLGRKLYADFSHDNDITTILSALGLYNTSVLLPNTTIVDAQQAGGYSAAWTVPFAARTYFEKMRCLGQSEELVRIIVNDRVQPLSQCGGDGFGRCTLSAWLNSLQFARSDGLWNLCFS